MLKTAVLIATLAIPILCTAETKVYQSTDNSGINKKEQIETIERYLVELGSQLKKMEEKIDLSTQKIKSLEGAISSLKDNDLKKIQEQISSKPIDSKAQKPDQKTDIDESEIEKIKADILALKNTDIEQVRLDINALKFSVKNLEMILKVSGK